MAPVKPRRSYRSPLRQEALVRGRKAIVTAAAGLFVEQGYARTTIDQIAVRAQVSRPTVFAVGTKAQLLALARVEAIAGDERLRQGNEGALEQILATSDASGLLRGFAHRTASIARRWAPLHAVLQEGAAGDPELMAIWRTSDEETRGCARRVIAAVYSLGCLRGDLRPSAATDVLWLLIEPSQYRRLVLERRWSHRAFEQWQGGAMIDLLIQSGGGRV